MEIATKLEYLSKKSLKFDFNDCKFLYSPLNFVRTLMWSQI